MLWSHENQVKHAKQFPFVVLDHVCSNIQLNKFVYESEIPYFHLCSAWQVGKMEQQEGQLICRQTLAESLANVVTKQILKEMKALKVEIANLKEQMGNL